MADKGNFKDYLDSTLLRYIISDEAQYDQANLVQSLEIEPDLDNFQLSDKFSPPKINSEESEPTKMAKIQTFEEDTQKNDNTTFASETIALIYERQGALSEAINIYKRLIEIEPDKKEFYINKIKNLENALIS